MHKKDTISPGVPSFLLESWAHVLVPTKRKWWQMSMYNRNWMISLKLWMIYNIASGCITRGANANMEWVFFITEVKFWDKFFTMCSVIFIRSSASRNCSKMYLGAMSTKDWKKTWNDIYDMEWLEAVVSSPIFVCQNPYLTLTHVTFALEVDPMTFSLWVTCSNRSFWREHYLRC